MRESNHALSTTTTTTTLFKPHLYRQADHHQDNTKLKDNEVVSEPSKNNGKYIIRMSVIE